MLKLTFDVVNAGLQKAIRIFFWWLVFHASEVVGVGTLEVLCFLHSGK